MILQKEIIEIAERSGVPKSTIDKVSKAWHNSLGNHLNPDKLPTAKEVFEYLDIFLTDKLKE